MLKKIVKKNQIIITSLAILIAVAGYLNYSEKNVLNQSKIPEEKAEYVNDVIDSKETQSEEANENQESNSENDDSKADNESTDKKSEENETSSEPGTAVLTNVGTFSANAKLQREQLRARNKEVLLEMINNQNLSESQKADVTKEMIHMTEIAELENEVETLLEAKGFTGAVVSINEGAVDVVVSMIDVSDKQRAQIEDVVKRKTNVKAADIIITPISVEN